MPIWQGKLRGKKWIVGSSNHGCWLGSYEYDKRILFERIVSEASVVFDIGAHVGFYSLLASVLVGSSGKVYAFEPAPRNLKYLREHLHLNRIKNVEVVELAVSNCNGLVSFDYGPDSSAGFIAGNGELKVESVTLDKMILEECIPFPDFIKIDVEGAEMQVLEGAESLLDDSSPVIFVATHGREIHFNCIQFLRSYGYDILPIGSTELNNSRELIAFRGDVISANTIRSLVS